MWGLARSEAYTTAVSLPCPVKLVIGTDKAVAGIVYNQQVVWPGILQERGHLHAQLDARVRDRRDGPFVGMVVVLFAEDLLQDEHIWLNRRILVPSQHQHRHAGVFRPEGLLLDVYGGILEMAGVCLELVALRRSWYVLGMRIMLWRCLRASVGAKNSNWREWNHPPGPGETHVLEAEPGSVVLAGVSMRREDRGLWEPTFSAWKKVPWSRDRG